jgi:hypothetical protein
VINHSLLDLAVSGTVGYQVMGWEDRSRVRRTDLE